MKSDRLSKAEDTSRRRFLKSSAVLAGGAALGQFVVTQPSRAADQAAVKLGLIGCGGRGTWIGELFNKHGGFKIVAAADYFQDKVDRGGGKLGVPAEKRFTGLNGYRRLLEQRLDAVAIESPPYFHPQQAAEAVAAGKHVYLAKPVAVDVPGCQTIVASGGKATANKLVFLVDFQTRATPAYQEVAKRVHVGEIGRIHTAEAAYQCSLMFAGTDSEFRKSARDATARLRAWSIDRVLSGDIITEQNIHALDVATWLLEAAPLKAVGTGGLARNFLGDCWDHFAVLYTFPNDVVLTFSSKQFGTYDDIMCRVYGASGTADTHYGGKVSVRGSDDVFSGDTPTIYADGTIRNIAMFYDSIVKGDFSNPTVAPSVRSNLTTILGRTAAYRKSEVSWEEIIRENEKWEFETRSLKA